MKMKEKRKNKMSVRQRKRSLETIAREGRLFCTNHDNKINVKRLYEKHCYIGRETHDGHCKYLHITKYRK